MSTLKTPLVDLLRTVPIDARLKIDAPDGLSTTYIPVGKLCSDAVTALQYPSNHSWVGITDDEYFQYQMKIKKPMLSVQDYIDAMKVIEGKLKEKNCEHTTLGDC
jgi:hypothetical protein